MLGYKIKINNIPEYVWACETTVNDYMWINRNQKDMLEISFSKYSSKKIIINGQNFLLKNSNLSCVVSDTKREIFCNEKEEINIVSVCVKIKELDFSMCELCSEDCFDYSTIILPAFIEDIPLSDELEILKIMHKIMKIAPDMCENTRAIFMSYFFELLYKTDAVTRKTLQQTNGSITDMNNYYVKKTDYIIKSQYSKKLSLNEIASTLNLSNVYLSTLYKKYSGMTFSDKLLQVRMKHAEEMLCNQNVPTAKVAALCGFCDEAYFRKQFKKFFGINVKEYRALKNGITLYHDKPLRKNYKK